ncbi:MAG: hypothetical protein ACHQ6U_09705 [Thermodesulfobacteriota bacterium]
MAENFPDSVRRFTDGSHPKELRLMAARGLVPASPKDLTLILYCLTRDEDPEVADEARETLNGIPPDVVSTVLIDNGANPGLLDYFARIIEDESKLLQIILNNSAADDTIAYLAEKTHYQQIIELIANNHERIARSEGIVDSLSRNPAVTRSTLDGVLEFLKLCIGKNFGRAEMSVTDTEAASVDDEALLQGVELLEGIEDTFLDDIELDIELIEETDSAGEHAPEILNQNVTVKVSMLNIGQKIKLAILGNREARTLLIRDPNRIVSKAVLKNSRLTDSEIVMISQSKIVNEEILREIAESRKWARLYQVKLSLVNNPKTPPHISINLLRQLRDFDLRNLRWNKNLPGAITTVVKQIMLEKRDKK